MIILKKKLSKISLLYSDTYFQLKFRYVKLLFYYLWDLRTWDLLKISTTTKKGSYVKCWVSLENIENNQFSVTSDGVGEQNKKVN